MYSSIKANSSNSNSRIIRRNFRGCKSITCCGCLVVLLILTVVLFFLPQMLLNTTTTKQDWKKGIRIVPHRFNTSFAIKNISGTVNNTTSAQNKMTYQNRFYNSSIKSTNSLFPPIIQAFSVESNINTAGRTTDPTSNSNSNSNKRVYRILAYGDSLTAGTSGFEYYPYAAYLEQSLLDAYRNDNHNKDSDGIDSNIIVRHRGIPGMTVQQMIDLVDDERRGIRPVLQAVINPSISIVIILAGTNDIGHVLMKHDNNIDLASTEIVQNLIALHTICYNEGIPYTIAIGIPSSGYQTHNANARNLVISINEQLQQYAVRTTTTSGVGGKMTYMEFPFGYEKGDEKWHADTLHFTSIGYQTLGQSLVPLVRKIIKIIDTDYVD